MKGGGEKKWVVPELPQSLIAIHTENAANLVSRMIMVNVPSGTWGISDTADRTLFSLGGEYAIEVIKTDSVH